MKNVTLMNINAKDVAQRAGFLYAVIGACYIVGGAIMIAANKPAEGIAIVIAGIVFPIVSMVMVWFMTAIVNWFLKKSGGIRITLDEK